MTKKKVNIELDFIPSEYQQQIFDFVQHQHGNAVVSAAAGCGKTFSMIAATKFIPSRQNILFIAFNKAIVEEITKKTKGQNNIVAKTAHSLGYSMICRNLDNNPVIDDYKYRTYLKTHLCELSDCDDLQNRNAVDEYIDTVTTLITYARYFCCQTIREIDDVAARFAIPAEKDECKVVLKCLRWGSEHIDTIDYTDMVWLPSELSMSPKGLQFDWIIIDEVQDLSIMMLNLFNKCFKRGTRFIAVGDENQCINLWAGASPTVFQSLKEYKNTTEFKLPITYRCDKAIVDFANKHIPGMIPCANAGEGIINPHVTLDKLKDGDMVISRNKSALARLYAKLLRLKRNAYIKGTEIGSNLIELLDTIPLEELNSNLRYDGVFIRLWDKLFEKRNELMRKRNLDVKDATLSDRIQTLYDSIDTLKVLSERLYTKSELIDAINNIFVEDSNGICLSTIHKAKGLEADNVYICCHSTMPSTLAKQPWEKLQEKNLQYVAYTRAKHVLGFLSEDNIDGLAPHGLMKNCNTAFDELRMIEAQVCQVLNKPPIVDIDQSELSAFRAQNTNPIDDNIFTPKNLITVDTNTDDKLIDDNMSKTDILQSFWD